MRRYGLLILLLIAALYLVAVDGLLWQDDGLPLIVSSGIRWNSGSVQGTDGTEMLVWSEAVNGNHDVYGMRLDSDGLNMWDEPHQFYSGKFSLIDPKIELSTDGNLFVSWLSGPADDDMCLQFSKFDWEGSMLWTEPIELSPVVYDFKNSKMISDQDGGVYLFWDYSGDWFAQRFDGDGNPVWGLGPLEIFDQNAYMVSDQTLYPDGQGGFIAVCNTYTGQETGYMTGVVRVMPDGSMPWGDDGCILLPDGTCEDIYRYNDSEFALLMITDTASSYLHLYRLNLDGGLVTDQPLIIDEGMSWSTIADLTSDADGNLYVDWLSTNDVNLVHTMKISPDNQFCWDTPFTFDNVISRPRQLHIGLDQSGNIYESWMSSSDACVQILKLNPNGELVWSDAPLDAPNKYETYVNLVMDVEDDGANLYWSDGHTNSQCIYKQKYSGDGTAQWEEDDQCVRQGFDSSIQYREEAENDEDLVDELFFAWKNRYDGSSYLQTVQPDGETGFMRPGFKFSTNPHGNNRLVEVIPVDDGYIIVWEEIFDDITHLYVNLFDSQGNRQWQEDILVETFDDSQSAYIYIMTAEMQDDDLVLCWGELTSSWTYNMMVQKVVDGQLAWDEPVLVHESPDLGSIKVVGDFFVFTSDGQLRALRLDDNGEPCEGWTNSGVFITHNFETNNTYTEETSEGLVVVWRGSMSDTSVMKQQIVHEDGSLKWDSPEILVNPCPANVLQGIMVDEILYIVWSELPVIKAQAFDLDGNAQWLMPVTVEQDMDGLHDVCKTSDGLLMAYIQNPTEDYCFEVVINHIDFEGIAWEEPIVVCNSPRYRTNVNIIPAQNDQYYITWLDNRDDIAGYSYFGQLYDHQPTGTDDQQDITPWNPGLSIYPNPFNPETTVEFSLANPAKVELHIYNVKGQLVRTLCNEILPTGVHHIKWDGTDRFRKDVSSGVYLMNLNIAGKEYRSKTLLLK